MTEAEAQDEEEQELQDEQDEEKMKNSDEVRHHTLSDLHKLDTTRQIHRYL